MDTEKVRKAIEETIVKEGYEIVAIEKKKSFGVDELTVFIDHINGVSIESCEKIHLKIDPIIDELDPSNGKPFNLSVSSPGLDRPFKTQRDFERNYNKKVEVRLYAPFRGKKVYEGVLIEKEENAVVIEAFSSERLKFQDNKVSKVSPFVSFEGLNS